MTNKRFAVLTGLWLLAPAAMLAFNSPEGLWEGTLNTPNGDIQFNFNLHRDGGKWAGEMDVPVQGVSGLPLTEVKVEGSTVSFALPGQGNPHYEGKLSDDGKTITGNLDAAGSPLAMNLKWKSEPRPAEKAAANSGDVQVLAGVWEGALEPQPGAKLHLRFNFVKDASGQIVGTLDSVDQGANGLPIGAISRTNDTVKLDLKAIAGGFSGTLSKDGSTLTGTFTQGGADLPLTLQRQGAAKDEKKN